jgi:hypothetical protein
VESVGTDGDAQKTVEEAEWRNPVTLSRNREPPKEWLTPPCECQRSNQCLVAVDQPQVSMIGGPQTRSQVGFLSQSSCASVNFEPFTPLVTLPSLIFLNPVKK